MAVLQEHHEHERGRGLTIQAGLYAGLVGHGVDDALKVMAEVWGDVELCHASRARN